MSIVPFFNRHTAIDAEIERDFAEELPRAFPPRTLLERERDEAETGLASVRIEKARIETAIVDLDTAYERNRAALVNELADAAVVLKAATERAKVLDCDIPEQEPGEAPEVAA